MPAFCTGRRNEGVSGRDAPPAGVIRAANDPPSVTVAVAERDGGEVTVVANASDPDGAVAGYRWYVDGVRAVDRDDTLRHALAGAGAHEVAVVVTDDDGATRRAAVTVTVAGTGAHDDGPGLVPRHLLVPLAVGTVGLVVVLAGAVAWLRQGRWRGCGRGGFEALPIQGPSPTAPDRLHRLVIRATSPSRVS